MERRKPPSTMAYERESRNCLPERPTERNMRCSECGRAIVPSFWYGDAHVSLYRLCSQPPVRLPLEQRRIQVAAGAKRFSEERNAGARRIDFCRCTRKNKPGRRTRLSKGIPTGNVRGLGNPRSAWRRNLQTRDSRFGEDSRLSFAMLSAVGQ